MAEFSSQPARWLKLDISPSQLDALGQDEAFSALIRVKVRDYVPCGLLSAKTDGRKTVLAELTKSVLDSLENDPNVISIDAIRMRMPLQTQMPLPDNQPIPSNRYCDFCSANFAVETCQCSKLPGYHARELSLLIQKELHTSHLPGYYFSPKDVYDIIEKYFGKECIGHVYIGEV